MSAKIRRGFVFIAFRMANPDYLGLELHMQNP